MTQGMLISVLTQFPMTSDVRDNLIATASSDTTFMNSNKDIIQRLCQYKEEKKLNIRKLEENIRQVRVDKRSRHSFEASAEKFRKEMEEAIIYMYTHLHLFQQVATKIIKKNNQIQGKLTQFNTI